MENRDRRVGIEYIKVYIKYDENNNIVCMCLRKNKRCTENCSPDVVERDKYRGWEDTFHRDRFGKCRK